MIQVALLLFVDSLSLILFTIDVTDYLFCFFSKRHFVFQMADREIFLDSTAGVGVVEDCFTSFL
jgi:hypothetical protein